MTINPPPHRGDVVLVDFPFSSGAGTKRRPALVVQNDRDNSRLTNTIIALIMTNLGRTHEPTHLLIDTSTADGRLTGLSGNSVVNCTVLFTIEQRLVIRRIGVLPAGLMSQVDECLRAALAL